MKGMVQRQEAELDSGRPRRALGCLLASALVLSLAAAAIAAPNAGARSVIVGPKQGQRVHQYPVMIELRSGESLFDLKRAKLNGEDIVANFGTTHGGTRTLWVSRSYGLRPGKNVLRVKARKKVGKPYESERISFVVKHDGPLVGAGRDRRIVEDTPFKLQGRALEAPDQTPGNGAVPDVRNRWKLTQAPRSSDLRDDLTNGHPGAPLGDPQELKTDFTPDVPGTYTFQIRASQGSKSSEDSVKLSVVPRSPLVPIDTMTTNADGLPAIKVANAPPYKADNIGDGVHQPWWQVLVLDRKTLGLISNTTYFCDRASNGYCIDNRVASECQHIGDLGCLKHDLSQLDDNKLVIAVNHQRPDWSPPGYLGFERIGVKATGAEKLPDTRWGAVSIIGVPGLPQGQADAKVVVGGQPGSGRMQGYLARDQYFNYTWLPPERPTFDTRTSTSCGEDSRGIRVCSNTMTVDGHQYQSGKIAAGYEVELFDGHTLQHIAGGTFETAGGNTPTNQMRDFFAPYFDPRTGLNQSVLVFITEIDAGDYQAIGADPGPINDLVNAIRYVGGSRDLFLRSGTTKKASGGYSLVGWMGAGEGNGEETSVEKDPTGGGRLQGALMRDHDQEFRPVTTSPFGQPNDELTQIMLQPPSNWPLDGNQGAQNAIAWIGTHTIPKLGSDPRSAYWTASKDQSFWNSMNSQIKDLSYPGDKTAGCNTGGFCEADFNAAKAELAYETLLVGNVRLYMSRLAAPFAGSALSSWDDLTGVANGVQAALKPPNDLSHMLVSDIIAGILDIVGVVTAEEAIYGELVAVTYTVALDYLTQARDGSDTTDISAKADEIKGRIKDTLLNAETALTGQPVPPGGANMGDIIVGDYAKLQAVGTNANCNAADPDCPPEWGLPDPAVQEGANGVYRSIEASFYQAYMPLTFPAYRLAPRSKYTDAKHDYTCRTVGSPKTFHILENEASDGFAPLYTQYPNLYDVFALANADSVSHQQPNPLTPPESITHRMFGPLSTSPNPKTGGLGIYAPDFIREAGEDTGTLQDSTGTYVNCKWPGG